jgi:hypothetical protein
LGETVWDILEDDLGRNSVVVIIHKYHLNSVVRSPTPTLRVPSLQTTFWPPPHFLKYCFVCLRHRRAPPSPNFCPPPPNISFQIKFSS